MSNDVVVHVVEDDPAMRDALLLLLRSANLEARGYGSAEEFLVEPDSMRSPCVLVDVRLPGMNGLALQRELALRRAGPAIVMITGHGDIPLAVAALKAGAMDFVTKPFDPAALLDSVRAAQRRVEEIRRRATADAEIEGRLKSLTPREVIDLGPAGGGTLEQEHCRKAGNQSSHGRASPCPHHGENAGPQRFPTDSDRSRQIRLSQPVLFIHRRGRSLRYRHRRSNPANRKGGMPFDIKRRLLSSIRFFFAPTTVLANPSPAPPGVPATVDRFAIRP